MSENLMKYNIINPSILDKKNWKKHQDSVLEMTDSVFGPGHCSFTKVKNGDEMVDCIVFHAK